MPASSVVVKSGRQQLQGLFDNVWTASGVIDFGSIADGDELSDTIAVPGVALGDIVIGVSASISAADLTITAYVSAANTVTVLVANNTGGAVNLDSATYRVVVGHLA